MRHPSLVVLLTITLMVSVSAAPTKEERAAKEKAVRMKTTRQLKEMCVFVPRSLNSLRLLADSRQSRWLA